VLQSKSSQGRRPRSDPLRIVVQVQKSASSLGPALAWVRYARARRAFGVSWIVTGDIAGERLRYLSAAQRQAFVNAHADLVAKLALIHVVLTCRSVRAPSTFQGSTCLNSGNRRSTGMRKRQAVVVALANFAGWRCRLRAYGWNIRVWQRKHSSQFHPRGRAKSTILRARGAS
jgi:hypothetical protein